MDNLDRLLAPLRGYVEELERMAGIVDAPPPAAEMPSPTQAFDTLRAQVGQHFADWTGPTGGAEPDPIAALVPPLSEWPADAVAWMCDDSGYHLWLVTQEDNDSGDFAIRYAHKRTAKAAEHWRRSLRVRPQTGA